MIRTIFFLGLLSLSINPTSAWAQSVIVFAGKFNQLCQQQNNFLAKRIFITYLKYEKSETSACDDQMLKSLLHSCSSQKDICSKASIIFKESMTKDPIDREKGNIFDQ